MKLFINKTKQDSSNKSNEVSNSNKGSNSCDFMHGNNIKHFKYKTRDAHIFHTVKTSLALFINEYSIQKHYSSVFYWMTSCYSSC